MESLRNQDVMHKIKTILLLLLFPTATLSGQITVWPGDASNNGECNHIDVLYMAMGYGTMGPARDSTNSAWSGQPLNSLWTSSTTGGLNHGYFDANGDGFVFSADTAVVTSNYLQTHGNVTADPSSIMGNPASPTLAVSFPTDSLTYTNDTTLAFNLNLGTPANQVQNLVGISFTLVFDTAVIDQVIPNVGGGFLTQGTSPLSFSRISGNELFVTIARSDRLGVTGAGFIGSISIVMDDNLRIASTALINVEVSELIALSPNGSVQSINPGSDSMNVNILTARTQPQPLKGVSIGPIPADDHFRIQSLHELEKIQLYDMQGRLIRDLSGSTSNNQTIDTRFLPSGQYILDLSSPSGTLRKKLSVQHPE